MKKLFLLFILFFTVNIYAQDLNWGFGIGSSGTDIPWDIAIDGSDNLYGVGYVNGTVDFDPSGASHSVTTSGSDATLLKYNSSGAFQWDVVISGSGTDQATAIAIDGSDNVIIGGFFDGTNVEFNPNGTSSTMTSGTSSMFLAKYTSAGVLSWCGQVDVSTLIRVYGIATDASDNIYIIGYFQGTNVDFEMTGGSSTSINTNNRDLFIAKYNSSGALQWAHGIGGSSTDEGYGIEVDGSSNVYVTGIYQTTVDFDPSGASASRTSVGSQDIFVAKYDTDGNLLQLRAIGSTGYETSFKIVIGPSNNLYVTGSFEGTADFDADGSGTANLTPNGSADIFIIKYDNSLGLTWAKNIGGSGWDTGRSIAVDNNRVYATGQFMGTADFDPDAGTANHTSAGVGDVYAASYLTSDGSYDKSFTFGGSNDEMCLGIALDGSGQVHLGAFVNGATVDIDPDVSATTNVTASSQDWVLASYKSSALPVELTYFKGEKTPTGNFLSWQTASEQNNKGFDIQRSTDGRNWENIGFVQGYGTTHEVQDYTFTDEVPLANKNYYRLKQMDWDGQFEYSDVVTIEFEMTNEKLQIFPNPVLDQLNIVDGEGQATIYNVLGQPVKQFAVNRKQFTVNTNDLPRGQYILHITQQNETTKAQRFVK